jgi:hypothetical protein
MQQFRWGHDWCVPVFTFDNLCVPKKASGVVTCGFVAA